MKTNTPAANLPAVRLADLGWAIEVISNGWGRRTVVATFTRRLVFLGPMLKGDAVRCGQRLLRANDTRLVSP